MCEIRSLNPSTVLGRYRTKTKGINPQIYCVATESILNRLYL